jgi:ribonuclease P protein component
VERNRVKRRLRELIRTEMMPAMAALDVVVRAAPGAYHADFDMLREAMRKAIERIRQTPAENDGERR